MQLIQRIATLEDLELSLNWRNDPRVRQFSRNSEIIQNDEHSRWFSARLKRIELEPFYLFMADGETVGMSRLEISTGSTDVYEISILVDPSKQGNGLGTGILNMTCKSFFELHPDKSINAIVHKRNYVSQRLFLSSGFHLKTPTSDFLKYEKSLRTTN